MNPVTCVGLFFLNRFPTINWQARRTASFLDGIYLVASRPVFYIAIGILNSLCQGAVCNLLLVEFLWV
jgi:hypothetical protein